MEGKNFKWRVDLCWQTWKYFLFLIQISSFITSFFVVCVKFSDLALKSAAYDTVVIPLSTASVAYGFYYYNIITIDESKVHAWSHFYYWRLNLVDVLPSYNLITYFFHLTMYDVRLSQYNYFSKCIAFCHIGVLQFIFFFCEGRLIFFPTFLLLQITYEHLHT